MARFAFTEEWMSLRASRILPVLAKEHEIHYIASGTEVPSADFASITLFKFPHYQQQKSIRIAGAARKLYRNGTIDFVVDYSYMGWSLQKVPFIEIVGGLYYNDFFRKWQMAPWYRRPRLSIGYLHYCLPESICIKRARQIVTDNLINAEIMHKKFAKPLNHIAVVPNGVDETFSVLYQTKDFSQPILLFVGNLHPRKGILPVLKRFSECTDMDVSFIICGEGPDRAPIEALAARDRRISYRRRVSQKELLEIEKQTTIFVFPSSAEGCPNALLEAMASGHACITCDVPTVQAVIKGLGIVCRPHDPAGIIAAISELLTKPETIRLLAQQTYELSSQYSWKYTAKCFGQLIEGVALDLNSLCKSTTQGIR